MTEPTTLRDLSGLGNTPSAIGQSALVIIDAQNTYRQGVMKLESIEPALAECRVLLERFRAAGRPVFHVQHDSGPGSPFDLQQEIGQIADPVAPVGDEVVITKHFPNAFVQTDLEDQLKQAGIDQLIVVGFMSHMCVNATARGAFSLGFRATVVGAATATRALPSRLSGEAVAAAQIHEAALAALSDLPAVVVPSAADVPD
ncbi:cysteine hydrolase family protein [Marinobacter xestospongiae]|uniref:Cysteine hydrolase family protein n=1 Tax=Marinobacter xestospongiae TaxID=994319 RepID=A0ABU3W353_9GAMM|nr:cysteine hydrolase family protein [Marinobacter xestospongiae]MDV2080969.1 cysteine hydrolase family protein [Marinobacter xestospongiae]